jgi:hypothetical protein
MAKREFWEDIIIAIDNLPSSPTSGSAHSIIDVPKIEGHLKPGSNPYNLSAHDLSNFESKQLGKVLNEINWDAIDISFDDRDEWEKEEICVNYRNDIEKPNFDACKEEFDRMGEIIRGEWAESTIEKCAWYQSYHYLPRTYWGIHILEDCWISYAKRIYKYNPHSKTKNDALKSAFLFLFCHELFHYITDNATSVLEVATKKSNIYKDYGTKVYAKEFASPGALEEALANRYLFGRYDFCRINKHLLFHILKGMPKGYRDFDKYNGSKFWTGRRTLINQIYFCSSLPLPADELPIEQVFEILNQNNYKSGHRIPIWLHTKKGVKSRIVFH